VARVEDGGVEGVADGVEAREGHDGHHPVAEQEDGALEGDDEAAAEGGEEDGVGVAGRDHLVIVFNQ